MEGYRGGHCCAPCRIRKTCTFFMNFVDRNERGTDEDQLASSRDAAGASTVRKGVERADAFDDCLRYATCGDRAGFGDVVTDSLEIVGSVRSPTDAHQPR